MKARFAPLATSMCSHSCPAGTVSFASLYLHTHPGVSYTLKTWCVWALTWPHITQPRSSDTQLCKLRRCPCACAQLCSCSCSATTGFSSPCGACKACKQKKKAYKKRLHFFEELKGNGAHGTSSQHLQPEPRRCTAVSDMSHRPFLRCDVPFECTKARTEDHACSTAHGPAEAQCWRLTSARSASS